MARIWGDDRAIIILKFNRVLIYYINNQCFSERSSLKLSPLSSFPPRILKICMKSSQSPMSLSPHLQRFDIYLLQEGASLFIKKGGEEFLIASLTKDRPQAYTNIFVSLADDVEFVVKGNGIVHAIGFYEPEDDGPMDFD